MQTQLMQGTIWMNHNYSRVQDWIACWSIELGVIEKLVRRGYTHCGSVRLVDRAKTLEKEIARLEDEKRRRL